MSDLSTYLFSLLSIVSRGELDMDEFIYLQNFNRNANIKDINNSYFLFSDIFGSLFFTPISMKSSSQSTLKQPK